MPLAKERTQEPSPDYFKYLNIKTMITSRRLLLLLMFCISCSIQAIAQTDYYYYYKGNKVPLTVNENKVVLSIPKENKAVSERIQANVKVQATIKDDVFDIFIISRSDFETLILLDAWGEDSKYVIQTVGLITERNEEVYTTPYINVRLKKEEDVDLLNTYMEKYKLRISFHRPSMPLWYGLSLTLDSEKGSIECANELWESGDFASSAPDFAGSAILDDATLVRSLSAMTSRESSVIHDLQGRRLTGKPTKGVYIENGRKKIR